MWQCMFPDNVQVTLNLTFCDWALYNEGFTLIFIKKLYNNTTLYNIYLIYTIKVYFHGQQSNVLVTHSSLPVAVCFCLTKDFPLHWY